MKPAPAAVLLALGVAAVAPARGADDPDLTAGARQVQQGDFKGALATLDRAAKRLSGARGREAERAQVHLWLGVSQAQLDADLAARESFRDALRLDPTVSLAEGWPAKVMDAFAISAQPVAAELEKAGRFDDAGAVYKSWGNARPRDPKACRAVGLFFYQPYWQGQPRMADALPAFERCAALEPGNAEAHGALGIIIWNRVYRDPSMPDREQERYIALGLASVEKALQMKPNLVDVMVFRGLFFRLKARLTKSPERQKEYLQQADRIRTESEELKAKGTGAMIAWMARVPPPPPPPPPPYVPEPAPKLAPPAPQVGGVVGGLPPVPPPPPPPALTAVRVGGEIKAPRKLIDVRPDYPAIAQSARVQGVVILECTVGPDGKVVDAKVLRSIPLLDEAARAAVMQWVYTPTLLNGVPVPVIMTVTVNFTLS
jgi:TonB family protein